MKWLRVITLLLAILLVIYGLTREAHPVYSLAKEEPLLRLETGDQFTESATMDRIVRKSGKLYDTASLLGEAADRPADCPT